MHSINDKQGVLEELRLSLHAVLGKLTCKVVHHDFWGCLPVLEQSREDIVSSFGKGHEVKSETHNMRAP
jgi:hypothetical protein